jgi:mannose-6-phosphate isomerase-like protein (cupin superfamily)
MDQDALLIKAGDVEPIVPPLHVNTDTWVLVRPDKTGNRQCEFYVTEMKQGGGAGWDTHPGCEHIYFVMAGRARMQVEDETYDLSPGDCLLMNEGVRHKVDVVGSETFRIAVVFAPGRV